jgi:pyruvate kinase
MRSCYDTALLDDLVSELVGIRRALLDAKTRHDDALACVPVGEAAAARNLIHYCALRRFDLRPLQRRLAALGLSSLGRCEDRVLANVEAVLIALHRLAEREWSPSPRPLPGEPGEHVELGRRTVELLGPARDGRPVRIMVTMPGEAAGDPTMAARLVGAGMDVARINAAHDDAATWIAIAGHVRSAAAAAGRGCRILFDLAGPKLRTAGFGDGVRVLRIKPDRDLRGVVLTPARVRLGAVAGPGGVPLADAAAFAGARPGDVIEIDEPTGRKRALAVESAAGGELVCTSPRSVRFETGAEVRLRRAGATIATARVGVLPAKWEPVRVHRGDELILGGAEVAVCVPPRGHDGRRSAPARLPTTLGDAMRQVHAGDPIWFDDGRIGGTVVDVGDGELRVRVDTAPAAGANLGPDKGINLPGTRLDLPRPTQQDVDDLGFAVQHADLVGFSFVEQPADVLRLQDLLRERGGERLGIVLKIETRRAFAALPQLLLAGMRSPPLGVMVARGDLAVEVGFARLAEVQEEILWLCEAAHVPVIWATQVLESLAKTGLPTRSEVSDAAMGVRAECVMLNKGPFLVEAVRMLDDVLRRMCDHQSKKRSMLRRLRSFAD